MTEITKRWSPAAAGFAIVAVLIVGGVGFAAFTSQATIGGSAQGGTIDIVFEPAEVNGGPSNPMPIDYSSTTIPTCTTPSYVVENQTPSPSEFPGSTITGLGARYLGPGDVVCFDFTVKNIGTLPAASFTVSNPFITNTCDTLFSASGVDWYTSPSPTSLAAGQSVNGVFWVQETSSMPVCNPPPSGTESLTSGFVFTVMGTA